MFKKYLLGFFLIGSLFSCKNEGNVDDIAHSSEDDKLMSDSIHEGTKAPLKDNLDTLMGNVELVDKKNEQTENHKKIVEKYGEQWDFCTCVVKGDSVNKALEDAADKDFDFLLERSDFIENKCKKLMAKDLKTPEDRQKHKEKVARCLR